MKIHVLPAGPIETNAYLLTSSVKGEAVLIDAPEHVWADVEPILAAEGARLREIWLTHGHWDHVQGVGDVVAKSGATVLGHPDDRGMLENPDRVKAFFGGKLQLEVVRPDRWIQAGERLPVFGAEAEVRHVPGHCPGNVLFYFAPRSGPGHAFVGDALFAGSIGRTDLPGGDSELLLNSIRKQIYTLPPETVVYPGHGPSTTVAREKAGNPYVRG